MDRTHILAAQSFTEDSHDRKATKTEIDAFYDAHGHEVFARGYRFRRWLQARAVRSGKRAKPIPRFASLASNR